MLDFGLDALGTYGKTKSMGKACNCTDDRAASGHLFHVSDKTLVDLDNLDWQPMQVAE